MLPRSMCILAMFTLVQYHRAQKWQKGQNHLCDSYETRSYEEVVSYKLLFFLTTMATLGLEPGNYYSSNPGTGLSGAGSSHSSCTMQGIRESFLVKYI